MDHQFLFDLDEDGSDCEVLGLPPFGEDEMNDSLFAEQEWAVAEDVLEFGKELVLPCSDAYSGCDFTLAECTPQALLPQALRWGSPQVHFSVAGSRKRARKKGVGKWDLAKVLHNLLLNPAFDVGGFPLSWQKRRAGYAVYESDAARLVKKSRRDVRPVTSDVWHKVPRAEKDRWAVVGVLRSTLASECPEREAFFRGTASGFHVHGGAFNIAENEESNQSPVLAKGLGLMRTFNTDWHISIGGLRDIMLTDAPLSQQVALLQALPELQTSFARYQKHVQTCAKKHGLLSWACSLEISLHAVTLGRVHLHDYMGPMLSHNLGAFEPRRVLEFRVDDQKWEGMTAFMSATSPSGRGSRKTSRMGAQALYYVACGKLGCVFSKCFPQPFEDLVVRVLKLLRLGFIQRPHSSIPKWHIFFERRCADTSNFSPVEGLVASASEDFLTIVSRTSAHIPCQDFTVEPNFVLSLWTAKKFSHEQAIADLYRTRCPAAAQVIQFVKFIQQHEKEKDEEVQQQFVEQELAKGLRPFIKHCAVEKWKMQYLPEMFGRLHRFKVLVLRGNSQAGKTLFAQSLFGEKQTLTVQCQGLADDDLPSLRALDRSKHSCIVFDEVRPLQVLNNKAFFQAGKCPVELAQSKCGGFRYRVWPYGLAMICCSNKFPMTVSEGLPTAEDEDWLGANCIVASFFRGQTCYVRNTEASSSTAKNRVA